MGRPFFEYSVPLGHRYEWVEAQRVQEDWSLVEAAELLLVTVPARPESDGTPAPPETFHNMFREYPAVFRDFAKLEPAADAIRGFAQTYGNLHREVLALPTDLPRARFRKPRRGIRCSPDRYLVGGIEFAPEMEDFIDAVQDWRDRGAVEGVPLGNWQTEISQLRLYLAIWEAIKRKDKRSLKELIRATKKGASVGVQAVGFGVETKKMVMFRGVTKVFAEADDLIGLGWTILQGLMPWGLPEAVGMTFSGNVQEGRADLKLYLRSLRDALWTQFAQAICEGRKYVECEVCGKSMQISPDTHRTNRKLCSNACKTAAYRQRQRRAQELREKGWNVRRIASEVGSDVATVKGWLEDKKKGRGDNGT